jgi:hypothetical protein
MQTKSSGKQTIAKGNMDDIFAGNPGGGHKTRHQFRPGADILFGVADDGRLAGCPG